MLPTVATVLAVLGLAFGVICFVWLMCLQNDFDSAVEMMVVKKRELRDSNSFEDIAEQLSLQQMYVHVARTADAWECRIYGSFGSMTPPHAYGSSPLEAAKGAVAQLEARSK